MDLGSKALDKGKEILETVLARIGRKKPEVAAEFREDPVTYQKPVEKALAEEMGEDPEFSSRLKGLFEAFEAAAKEHAAATGRNYTAIVTGSGAIAQDGGVAAGAGGIAIGGVGGDIVRGGPKDDEKQGSSR
jgi:hypothetical protein